MLELLNSLAGGPQAKGNSAFLSRLSMASTNVADKLVTANEIGLFHIAGNDDGNVLNVASDAEHISCDLGVLGAYGRLMELLRQPAWRARRIEKNGDEVLEPFGSRTEAEIIHATQETKKFLYASVRSIATRQAEILSIKP